MKQCKWCNNEFEKLGKSHIIPSAFVNQDGKHDRFLVEINDYKRRRPTGSWDDGILCNKCEEDYSDIDSRASYSLLNNFDNINVPFNDKRDDLVVKISEDDIQYLKRFLIYTLWKCSVSSLREFRQVRLGPFEDRIKDDLVSNKIFTREDYSFIGYVIKNPLGAIMPFKRKPKDYDGRNYYNLDFGRFVFDIKIDSRKIPLKYSDVSNLLIKFDKPTPKRFSAMARVIKGHEARHGKNK